MSPRENAVMKGRRLLTEGRLGVTAIRDGEIEAFCRGDSAEIYRLGYRYGSWWCSCPSGTASHVRCSHVRALQLVVVVTPAERVVA